MYHQQTKNLLVVRADRPGLQPAVAVPALEERHRPALRPRTRPRTQRDPGDPRLLTVTGPGLDFPHAVQAARLTRHRTDAATGKRTRQTVYALTDLTHEQASPQFLGRLAHSQWTIADRLHFIRDTAFHENTSKIRTGRGQENLATLRNQAANVLRKNGHTNIPAGLRHVSYDPSNRPLDLLGIA
ncbi:hypothetical protein [Streptomyces sp. ME18-1-4]|uniref:hypothetical protein n=1 Tax=Streptomyces sp. ME18-1-4 TaxID=3028685 RepID=UPI0029AB25F6|nr:hypothetical protein [Streptomyces sp. ME18-1-4]MDX3244645.1 hypothetical protein [Streptomyces sp. ME18-1-4]